MGANVESDFAPNGNHHTFATSKGHKHSINKKIEKIMKKMMIALVAMFVMTMSANAQDVNNNSKLSFDRLSSYLELTTSQVEPVKTAMAQFSASMESVYRLQDGSKAGEAWQKVQDSHKATMKKILSEKQYNKYMQMMDLTIRNTTERMMENASADNK